MFLTDEEMTDVIHYLSEQLDKEQKGIKTLLSPLVLQAADELSGIGHERLFDALSYYSVSALLDNDFIKATELLGINKQNLDDPLLLILALPLRVYSLWSNSDAQIPNKLSIQPIPITMDELLKILT